MDYVKSIPHRDDVPVLSYTQLETIAAQVLSDTRPDSITKCEPIPVELIMEKSFGLNIEPRTMVPDGSILGQTYFQDREDQFYVNNGQTYGWTTTHVIRKTVVIDAFMYENEPQRLAFTLAHELAHWVLHQLFYKQDTEVAGRTRASRDDCVPYNPRTPIEWTEWQADRFAACFLLPRDPVRQVTKIFLNDLNLDYTRLVNFEDPRMRTQFIELSSLLAKTMGVSRDCARIRLEKLFGVRYSTR